MNNVTLMGRLVADPELKTTGTGISVLSFTLAVSRRYVKQGEERQADFIDCVAWRNTAEFISRYFNKGQMIAVVGEINTRNYEDRDGKKRKATEVVVSQADFCAPKADVELPIQYEDRVVVNENPKEFTIVSSDEDLPF